MYFILFYIISACTFTHSECVAGSTRDRQTGTERHLRSPLEGLSLSCYYHVTIVHPSISFVV